MRSRVPLNGPMERVVAALNEAMAGHIDASLQVTLAHGATSTVVTDARISNQTAAAAAPMTATAAAALASGAMFWVPSKSTLTITHDNTADTDRTFMFSLIG